MENVVNLQARREERTRERELASKEEIGIAFTLMSTNFVTEDRLFAYGTFTPDTLSMIEDRMKSTGDIWRENKSLWYQSYTDSIVDIASVSVNDHESQQVYKDIGASGGRMVEIPARWYALKRHEIMDIEMITSPTSFSWRMKSRINQRELHTAAFDLIDVGIIRASLLEEEGDS